MIACWIDSKTPPSLLPVLLLLLLIELLRDCEWEWDWLELEIDKLLVELDKIEEVSDSLLFLSSIPSWLLLCCCCWR